MWRLSCLLSQYLICSLLLVIRRVAFWGVYCVCVFCMYIWICLPIGMTRHITLNNRCHVNIFKYVKLFGNLKNDPEASLFASALEIRSDRKKCDWDVCLVEHNIFFIHFGGTKEVEVAISQNISQLYMRMSMVDQQLAECMTHAHMCSRLILIGENDHVSDSPRKLISGPSHILQVEARVAPAHTYQRHRCDSMRSQTAFGIIPSGRYWSCDAFCYGKEGQWLSQARAKRDWILFYIRQLTRIVCALAKFLGSVKMWLCMDFVWFTSNENQYCSINNTCDYLTVSNMFIDHSSARN